MNKGALIFQIQDRNYAIDLLAIDEVLPMMETRPVAGFPPYMEGLILLRGQPVPVVDLQKYFGLARKDWPWESRILILTVQEKKIGFITDRVQKIQNVEPGDAACIEANKKPAINIVNGAAVQIVVHGIGVSLDLARLAHQISNFA